MFISFLWGVLSGGFLARGGFVQGFLSGFFCPDTVFDMGLSKLRLVASQIIGSEMKNQPAEEPHRMTEDLKIRLIKI